MVCHLTSYMFYKESEDRSFKTLSKEVVRRQDFCDSISRQHTSLNISLNNLSMYMTVTCLPRVQEMYTTLPCAKNEEYRANEQHGLFVCLFVVLGKT